MLRDRLVRATIEYAVALTLWIGSFVANAVDAPGTVTWPLLGTSMAALVVCLVEIALLHR